MIITLRVACMFSLCVVGANPAGAIEPPNSVDAPPLAEAAVLEDRDLGLWHDVNAPPHQDVLLLRRHSDLFRISMHAPTEVAKVNSNELLRHSEIRGSRVTPDAFWLFFNSSLTVPFAMELGSGRIVMFDVPELNVPGNGTPRIQSIVDSNQAMIIMVQGGDRVTWPRNGSRPLYYRFDLNTGDLTRYPTGWDLNFFSPDQRVAVFQKAARGWQAVEIDTGSYLDETLDYRRDRFVPFDWGDEKRLKPVYGPEGTPGHRIVGLSVPGTVHLLTIHREGRHYIENAQAGEPHLMFRFRPEGAVHIAPVPLYAASTLEPEAEATLVDESTIDVQSFPGGNALFVSSRGEAERRRHHIAYFYDPVAQTSWDVFSGVDGLDDLDAETLAKPFIEDQRRIYLIAGFGSSEFTASSIAVFDHSRGDMRSSLPLSGEPRVPIESWRRAIIVTADGARRMTRLFSENESISSTWYHNSGTVYQGWDEWSGEGESPVREIRLQMTRLEL